MIYWNNIYWKIISGSLEKVSNKTSLTCDNKLVLEYKPIIYSSDGFCIKGFYSGNVVIKINNEEIIMSSNDLTNFKIAYIDGVLTVNGETKNLKLDNDVKIEANFEKNSKGEKWCICPKKVKNYPSCFINF